MNDGAHFYKADLHIHSYGVGTGSYDVTDLTNTPQNIVDTAISKGLKVISITDHNEILNSFSAIQYAIDKDILVIPGIEVSTTQGHLLVYFESYEQLRHFYGNLTFNDDKSICNQSITDCLNIANRHQGLGVLAHITLESGFEKSVGRFGPHMEQIFRCKNLVGLEITRKTEAELYTDQDSNVDHQHLLEVWRSVSDNKLHRDFAKLMSSDSHELARLGSNADGNNRLTRLKMPELTFRSFKNALFSSESRVRLEDQIPDQRPIIKHVKIDGDLLDGVDVDLSPNLTCIIGSRGAGKSTLLESIRETTGNHSSSRICDSEVWPQTITLDYVDEAGQVITLQRDKNASIINRTDPVNGITTIPIESYGQGDTANTIQHSDDEPQVLIDFLDSFLSLENYRMRDYELIEQLRYNQSEMRKLRINLASLPEAQRALVNEKKKLAELEKTRAADIVRYHNALIREREFRSTLIQELNALVKQYKNILDNKSIFNNVASMNDDSIIVGKDFFAQVKRIVEQFSVIVNQKGHELNEALNSKIVELNKQLDLWKQKESEIQTKIDAKKQELTKAGIPFDLGKINQISKDILDIGKRVRTLEDEQKKLKELQEQRKAIIQNRIDNKKEILRLHTIFAEKINQNLKNSVDEFFITVKYKENLYSPEFEETLKTLMAWRTVQVSKAAVIARNISVYDFVNDVKKKNPERLKAITNNGYRLLSDDDIQKIFITLNDNSLYEELECAKYDDLPEISVAKHYIEDGIKKTIVKKIGQLSLGQQQSVLLGILLLSDTDKPLLIDQPEDNLDSEFIFKTIVYNLRKIKEHRQVIIVTHNPNIAVLGDAELIIPLKSTNNRSRVINPGSIDNEQTIELCCQILEGGESAFKQRNAIYGF